MRIKFRINKKEALVFALFFLASLVLTWPLAVNILHAIPGDGGDSFLYFWDQGWLKYCLLNFHNPYFTNYIAYPFTSNLSFSALTAVNSLAGALLELILPKVLAFNLVFLLALSVGSYFMYRLTFYLTRNRYVSFFSGLALVYCSYVYGEMLGHYDYLSVYFLPLFILFLIKTYREGGRKNCLIAGAILAASFYNCIYYTIGLFVLFGLFALLVIFKKGRSPIVGLKQAVIILAAWAVISLPALAFSFSGYFSGQYPMPTLPQNDLYSPDLKSFFTPSSMQTVYGGDFLGYYKALNFHNGIVYFGFVLFFLAIIGFIFRCKKKDLWQSSWPWAISGGIFFILSLGPLLYRGGNIFSLEGERFTIPLPFIAFHFLPFANGILVPPRLIIFTILSLAVLASFALTEISQRINSRIIRIFLVALFAGLVVFENISLPISLSKADVPKFYSELGRSGDEATILELPFALSTSYYTLGSVPASSKLEYYQLVHKQKILNAWISRVPDSYYNFYSQLLGLDYLINPSDKLPAEKIQGAKGQIKLNFAKLNIKYIIVHPEYYSHAQLVNTLNFLKAIYGRKPEMKEGMLVYQLYPN